MSPEAALRAKRQGLRIAAAVAVGFTLGVSQGEVLPFLAPMFAAQFLVAGQRPLGVGQAIVFVALILVVGEALVWLTAMFGDRPATLLALLGLIYFLCFFMLAKRRAEAAVFVVLVISIMVPMLGILQTDLSEGVIYILFKGAVGGVVLMWLAYAAFPDPGGQGVVAAAPPAFEGAVARAVANTTILLLIVVVCLSDSRFSTAIVVPITVASLLNQLDVATSGRTALGLLVVNLVGGVVASVAFAVIELRPTLLGVFLVVLVVALSFGGRAAADPKTGKVYAGALSTFLILLGLGVSPLPASTPDSFATRIGFVMFAIAYTFCLTALLWPAPARRRALGAPAVDR